MTLLLVLVLLLILLVLLLVVLSLVLLLLLLLVVVVVVYRLIMICSKGIQGVCWPLSALYLYPTCLPERQPDERHSRLQGCGAPGSKIAA